MKNILTCLFVTCFSSTMINAKSISMDEILVDALSIGTCVLSLNKEIIIPKGSSRVRISDTTYLELVTAEEYVRRIDSNRVFRITGPGYLSIGLEDQTVRAVYQDIDVGRRVGATFFHDLTLQAVDAFLGPELDISCVDDSEIVDA